MIILERILELHKARGWSEYRLSEEADIHQSTISSWYSKQMLPSIASLEKICKGFNITLSQFFAENGEFVEITKQQSDLLNKWILLNNHHQDAILNLIDSIISK